MASVLDDISILRPPFFKADFKELEMYLKDDHRIKSGAHTRNDYFLIFLGPLWLRKPPSELSGADPKCKRYQY